MSHPRSSRQRYQGFVGDYHARKLDDAVEPGKKAVPEPARPDKPKRRQYLRDYVRWLWPHRVAIGLFFVLALVAAGLEMVEPLFLRFIVDRVLLNTSLDTAARMSRLNVSGSRLRRGDRALQPASASSRTTASGS